MKNFTTYVALLIVLLVILLIIGVLTHPSRQATKGQRMIDAYAASQKNTVEIDPFLEERRNAFIEGRTPDLASIIRQRAWESVYGEK